MLLFNFVNREFFLFMYYFYVCIVSLFFSIYCLCVNVYCTTASGCQSNCS